VKNKNQLRELISETISSSMNEIVTYYIQFHPDSPLDNKFDELKALFESLKQHGRIVVLPSLVNLPDLQNLKPDFCYLSWEIILSTSYDINEIKKLFKGILSEEKINLEILCNYNALKDEQLKTKLISLNNYNSKVGSEKIKETVEGKNHSQSISLDSRGKGINLLISTEKKHSKDEEPLPEIKNTENSDPKNKKINSEKTNTLKLSELTVQTIENTKAKIDEFILKGKDLNIVLEDISSIDLSYIQLILSLGKSKMNEPVKIVFKGEMQESIRIMLDNAGFSFIK